MMAGVQVDNSTKGLAQVAVQANKSHQHALRVYTERLEAELETVDRLLDAADIVDQDDEPEVDVGGFVLIPGSVKPAGLVASGDLITPESPFYEDAIKRVRYLNFTAMHSMKNRELEALVEAVRTENYRKHAFDAQTRGFRAFPDFSDKPPNFLELDKQGIDWSRVAEKVSLTSSTPRTARECEIRWLGDRHPEINHTTWDQDELSRLKCYVAGTTEGTVDWVDVAEKLGTNRTPLDCMKHALTRKIHIWETDSDKRLLQAMSRYGTENWNLVARYVSEDATSAQCSNRWHRSLDPSVKRGAWSAEEDERLRLAYAAYGPSWVDVASALPGRHNDQCRDRMQDQLNPTISKGKWSNEEDKQLLQLVETIGPSKWKEVSNGMSGRSDNMCRGRYEVLLKKKGKEISPDVPESIDQTPGETSRPRPRPRPRPRAIPKPAATTEGPAGSGDSTGLPSTEVPPTTTTVVKPRRSRSITFLDPVVDANPEKHAQVRQDNDASGRSRVRSKGKGMAQGVQNPPEDGVLPNTSGPPAKRRKTTQRAQKGTGEMSAAVAGLPPAKINHTNSNEIANGKSTGSNEALAVEEQRGTGSGQLSPSPKAPSFDDTPRPDPDDPSTENVAGQTKKQGVSIQPTRVQPRRTARKVASST